MEDPAMDEKNKKILEKKRQLRRMFLIVKELSVLLGKTTDHCMHMTAGTNIAIGAIIRLFASFDAALVLINKGFSIEAFSIFRMIFEVLAYSLNIKELDSFDAISNLNATKYVNYLNGNNYASTSIYGFLSEITHLSVNNSYLYISAAESHKDPLLMNINTKQMSIILDDDIFSAYVYLIFLEFRVVEEIFYHLSARIGKVISKEIDVLSEKFLRYVIRIGFIGKNEILSA